MVPTAHICQETHRGFRDIQGCISTCASKIHKYILSIMKVGLSPKTRGDEICQPFPCGKPEISLENTSRHVLTYRRPVRKYIIKPSLKYIDKCGSVGIYQLVLINCINTRCQIVLIYWDTSTLSVEVYPFHPARLYPAIPKHSVKEYRYITLEYSRTLLEYIKARDCSISRHRAEVHRLISLEYIKVCPGSILTDVARIHRHIMLENIVTECYNISRYNANYINC